MERHLKGCLSVTFANQDKPSEDPAALRNLTYGLFVLTAKDQDKDNGCIANTCVQVGANPTRIAISVQMGNLTREMIEKTGKFNVSVLTEDVPFETIRCFGMQSGRDVDKFADFRGAERSHNGLYYLAENTNAMFSAEVKHKIDLGSHMMFIGEVTESKALSKGAPCTYAHYHKAIKP
ncbi:MAG: flavin reductase family protein, partial [Oscillospiraceae bacterium]